MPTISYSESEYKAVDKKASILSEIVRLVENGVRYQLNQMNETRREGGEYVYIPLSTDEFMHGLAEARKVAGDKRKFLEIGCGFATKSAIAYEMGCRPTGIEMDESLVKLSQYAFGSQVEILHVNAFDFDRYQDFDIIYYYCPIADGDKERKLERLIESKMKKGAVLLPALKMDGEYKTSEGFKVVSEYPLIIQKVK
jgi:SAM-dependent methyltransferase